jgi:hypothetical protein
MLPEQLVTLLIVSDYILLEDLGKDVDIRSFWILGC